MEITVNEAARQAIAMIMELAEVAGPSDPALDEVSAFIAKHMRRVGFMAELLRQARAAEIELKPEVITQMLVSGLKAARAA